MTTSQDSSARFRSATEFPKTIENLNCSEANNMYVEMRDCLIFTNRSRSQLIRRNEEHKQTALSLKSDIERLQGLINQLSLEKELINFSNRQIVSELQQEMAAMAGHLDELSNAFTIVSDIDNPQQAEWAFLAFPNRFVRFLRAIKAIVLWWREEQNPEGDNPVNHVSPTPLLGDPDLERDRRDNPQMYSDPASQGRSLLDR
jgi:hypothetical protein